jgi:peptidoglycan biosynthesis protein MviN/MurJ (putative lipid II flippase)
LGIIGISFAVAAFPLLSRAVAEKKEEVFSLALLHATRQILFFLIPPFERLIQNRII